MKTIRKRRTQAEPIVDRRVGRTRRAIKAALLELLREMPLEQLSIREIAERADVGYTTFYRHYPDKETLLAKVADNEIVDLLEHCWPILESSNSYAACLALCRYVRENRLLWTALLTGGAAATVRAAFIARSKEQSTQWEPKLEWLPADIGTSLIVGVHLELLTWWLRDAPGESPERIAEILDKLLVSTLISTPATGR